MAELTTDEIVSKIRELANKIAAQAGLDVVDLKVKRHQGDIMIELAADRLMGGITMEECSTLNRGLIQAIDDAAFIPIHSYTLEVASPGLDRPLVTYKDFMRSLNYDIHFYLYEAVNGKKELEGLLMAATPEMVTVFTKKKIEVVIPLANISRGILII